MILSGKKDFEIELFKCEERLVFWNWLPSQNTIALEYCIDYAQDFNVKKDIFDLKSR